MGESTPDAKPAVHAVRVSGEGGARLTIDNTPLLGVLAFSLSADAEGPQPRGYARLDVSLLVRIAPGAAAARAADEPFVLGSPA